MSQFNPSFLLPGLQSGEIVPYLGADALAGSVNVETGAPIPADSDSLILAMNNGRPMAPKLMYEFARAAMNIELKRGRTAVTRFLEDTYAGTSWTRAPLHDWVLEIAPRYVIDVNRDLGLQEGYTHRPHILIRGLARLAGTDYRFRIDVWDGESYREMDQAAVDPSLPILFKPMGSPFPAPSTFIASDADYVDYITELMGGFAIPSFLKKEREGKKYLFLGMRFTRDTERMVMADITYGADPNQRGWAVIAEPTAKEERYCKKMGIEIIEADLSAFESVKDAA